jgi:hypothetical protein
VAAANHTQEVMLWLFEISVLGFYLGIFLMFANLFRSMHWVLLMTVETTRA